MSRHHLYYAAFFTDATLRRTVTYAAVIYGAEVLGGGYWAGLLYLCLELPYLLSLHAGSVIDSFLKRSVLQVTAGATLATMLALFAAEKAGAPGIIVAAILLAYGTVSAFSYPTFFAAVPEVIESNCVQRSTVVVNILSMISHVCGPVAVGVLRATLSWPAFFGVLAVMAATGWLFLQGAGLHRTPAPVREKSSVGPLRELYLYCRTHPSLPALMLMITAFSGLVMGPLEVLTPLFADTSLRLSPLQAGAFLATGGAGLVVGAFGALKLVSRGELGVWLCGSTALGGLLIAGMSFTNTEAAFVLFFVSGVLGGVFSSLSIAGMQVRASDLLRGRIMGLFTLLLSAPAALGGVIAGSMSDALGTVATMRIFFATVVVVFVVFFATLKSLRREASVASA